MRFQGADGPPVRLGRVGVFSRGILRIPHLAAFLGADELVFRPDLRRRPVDAVVGWGRKPNTRRAFRHAQEMGVPYYFLEDGFLRSVLPGVVGEPPLSIVVDDLGVYYDATRPSRLERALSGGARDDPLDDPATVARARGCIDRIRRERLSKYNHAPHLRLGPTDRRRVLVIDQTAGDLSVRFGQCVEGGLRGMLAAALEEHPGAEIVVKVHPDVATGKKGGYLTDVAREGRVTLLAEPCNPVSLLEQVQRVYVATSLMGFEALMCDREVTCFGAPFYAGWGLTDDRTTISRRGRRRTVEQVFAAAYLSYARYVDPETGKRCDPERVIEHLALQRRMGDANAGAIHVVGMSSWKRGFVPSFLRSPRNSVRFAKGPRTLGRRRLDADSRIVVWGSREDPAVRDLADRHGAEVWRMEDGFLRSVGLGSDLYAPASLVVDRLGIYYDPTRPSELERILETGGFEPEELARAARLRALIVSRGISKYNVGGAAMVGPARGDDRRVVLVVGQVEDDASIQLGCVDVRRNEDLLAAARRRRPEAFVIFKPHPDVVSGNRRGHVPPERARVLADRVVEDADLAACLEVADEVHTLTSLVGFEALLRGLPVRVYGQPFYSGWGLTEDAHPHPRRTRRVTLDELVAGTLIRYPRYVSRRTGAFTTPEAVVEQLTQDRERARGFTSIRRSWPARQARKLGNLMRGWR